MPNRKVGTESQRTYKQYLLNGFFKKYMTGKGLDIGYAGYVDGTLPILPTAIGVDTNYTGYDGVTLPFADASQDYVYSSHCLEHIADYKNALRDWFRVLKIGGHIVLTVPHQFLYEKKAKLPSTWNLDHKRFYTPASLLAEVEQSLKPNTYRIRLLEDGDQNFNYSIPPERHSSGQYEILLVLQKITPPAWDLA